MIVLLISLIITMFPTWLFGAAILIQILKKPPFPVDKSNLFNRFRLLWFAISRQNLFVDLFPWLKNDELDNVNKN